MQSYRKKYLLPTIILIFLIIIYFIFRFVYFGISVKSYFVSGTENIQVVERENFLYHIFPIEGKNSLYDTKFPISKTITNNLYLLAGLSPDKENVAFVENDKGDKSYSIFLYEISTQRKKLIFKQIQKIQRIDWLRDNTIFINSPATIGHLPDTGFLRIGIDGKVILNQISAKISDISNQKDIIIYTKDKKEYRLYKLDGNEKVILKNSLPVEFKSWSPKGDYFIFQSEDTHGKTAKNIIYRLELKNNKFEPLLIIKDNHFLEIKFNQSGGIPQNAFWLEDGRIKIIENKEDIEKIYDESLFVFEEPKKLDLPTKWW